MEYIDDGEEIYKLEEENNTLSFALHYATTQVTRKEEVYMYPFRSFLAEFGGALGMFLGFSFLMVWDFIRWILERFRFFETFIQKAIIKIKLDFFLFKKNKIG